jgi:hypothetical protein
MESCSGNALHCAHLRSTAVTTPIRVEALLSTMMLHTVQYVLLQKI